jgi:hypothetical protein
MLRQRDIFRADANFEDRERWEGASLFQFRNPYCPACPTCSNLLKPARQLALNKKNEHLRTLRIYIKNMLLKLQCEGAHFFCYLGAYWAPW